MISTLIVRPMNIRSPPEGKDSASCDLEVISDYLDYIKYLHI